MEVAKIALAKAISFWFRPVGQHVLGIQRCVERQPLSQNSAIQIAHNALRWCRNISYDDPGLVIILVSRWSLDVAAQWHQWLRHARQQGPSIEEQKFELQRQAALKQLAAEADQRWRSQPSYLDHPIQTPDTDQSKGVGTDLQERGSEAKTYERDPGFSHERRIGAPSQYWQPKAWQPQRGPRDP